MYTSQEVNGNQENKRTFGSFFFLYSLHSVLYKCRSLEFKAHIKVQVLILHFAVFYSIRSLTY